MNIVLYEEARCGKQTRWRPGGGKVMFFLPSFLQAGLSWSEVLREEKKRGKIQFFEQHRKTSPFKNINHAHC